MAEDELVRTHIVTDDPGPNILAEALRYIENTIRAKFQLNEKQRVSAIVVGSAKLGFSFIEKRKNGALLKPAYRSYTPGVSDVDIAIISPVVYGKIWSDLASIGARQVHFPSASKLGNYMYHGWLRPDLFPTPKPQRCADWTDAYRELQQHPSLRNKRLRLALYHSQHFLETYQQRGIRVAKDQEQIL
ncbi:hypothetical protein [Aetokthonos hydrillicola]|uniref:hypothetical protein n=1 Tax=Aetokthonos hydrillicola TaxID=1550245 RepID=UPI001ABB5E9B|nr:hypothetical protein [Aetokthonos hydrillicola]MBO3464463.1 hypothetical protein [Aetokthonos hydrillicola CCALA 1050]